MKSCSTTTIALRKHWRLHRASKAPPARSVGSPQAKSMSTIRVLNNVPVHLPEGLSEKQLLSFRPFQQWTTTLDKSLTRQSAPGHPFHKDPYSLRSITVQSFDLWGHERIGFIKVLASVSNSAGEALPASAFLRGPSVAMLVMLIPDDAPDNADERYVVLTVQPRVPAGSLSFVELPAGMVDDAGSFRGAAAKEIEEELGITIHEDELVSLNDLAAEAAGHREEDDGEGLPTAMFPSAGGCDEHITIFSCERRIPRSQLSEWNGRLTGLRSEGEKITLKLVPMKNLWMEGARDAKCLGALALWEALRREKKLKHTRQEQEN
ncbi:NUDIX family hydrolase [Metarhizium robertsii ARSEF 23]|uniref:NUDIX family hydrolase n=1 Tax=Metarhizium robertsii (strain ARSEF 23 / ATCC MYA-3075) TaxID=655844 RepID=E9FDF1_METRA|nr:NUDIX family hydrolase [Metarhizium robertsii ARSEF 23]EFY94232.2 NUDIX family hydrolase [Metarhizium robertsii ARSEF 23]